MKKYSKSLVYIILVFCLVSCVLAVNYFVKNKSNENVCDEFLLEDIVVDINMATKNNYLALDEQSIILNTTLSFSEKTDYVFAGKDGLADDYFLVAINLDKEKIKELEQFVKIKKEANVSITIEKKDQYLYIIRSDKNHSTIEGIIRSYIYCER